jgi:hypothetical protein
MVTDTPTPASACPRECRPPRHRHPSPDLNATAVPCPCGAVDWWVMSGGPLPAAVACGTCHAQTDLEQLLLRNGRRRYS